jgi:hypothetical protein
LHDEAETAQTLTERQTNLQGKTVMQELAANLIEIAERLERDARAAR